MCNAANVVCLYFASGTLGHWCTLSRHAAVRAALTASSASACTLCCSSLARLASLHITHSYTLHMSTQTEAVCETPPMPGIRLSGTRWHAAYRHTDIYASDLLEWNAVAVVV